MSNNPPPPVPAPPQPAVKPPTSQRLAIPVASLNSRPPTHRISCVHLMNEEKYLITGGQDGQICIWEVEHFPVLTITPRSILFGHTAPVLCIADGDFITKNTIVTSCDSGEMCLWKVDDSQCLETKKTQYVHTFMQSFEVPSKECRLFCIGHYAEILVIDPKTFAIRFRLSSKEQPDWISSIHILQPPQLSNIVIIGLSIAGVVRIWTITDEAGECLDPIYDNDRKELPCTKSVQIISNPESLRLILIVCPQRWEIYDATDFERLCTADTIAGSRWAGGNFITRDQVLVWTDKGEGYLYQVTTKRNADKQLSASRLKAKFSCANDPRFLYPPKMRLTSTSKGKLLLRGDNTGAITVWPVNTNATQSQPQEQIQTFSPKHQQSLDNAWKQTHIGEDEKTPSEDTERTSSVYMPALGKLACAKKDGTILVKPVNQSIDSATGDQSGAGETLLRAHQGSIDCLLYPYGSNPRYDKKHLVSGGSDFAVCLWDAVAGTLLHRFVVHAGKISQLLVPPNRCSSQVQSCICSVASDHSVAILNLSNRKCNLLASVHLFPVQVVKWRPSDDSLVVGCTDGSAYIWRLETGHLTKVLHGSLAEHTLRTCDQPVLGIRRPVNPVNDTNSSQQPLPSLSSMFTYIRQVITHHH